MIMYRTRWNDRIDAIEVDRETEKSVFIKGRRESKRTDWQRWFSTFEDAKKHIINTAENNIIGITRKLEEAKAKLEEVRNIKPA